MTCFILGWIFAAIVIVFGYLIVSYFKTIKEEKKKKNTPHNWDE